MREAVTLMILSLLNISKIESQNISESDREFINSAAQANMLEIKLGELAQSHTTTDKVMLLGRHMMEDHGRSESELKTLAAKKGVVLPSNLDAGAYKVYDKLVNKQGREFDKAYTKYMAKDHKKDVEKFKKQAEKGDDVDVKAWALNSIPTLEHHKIMSEEACKAVKEMK